MKLEELITQLYRIRAKAGTDFDIMVELTREDMEELGSHETIHLPVSFVVYDSASREVILG